MRSMFLFLFMVALCAFGVSKEAQAQSARNEVVELEITPAFTPEDLNLLIQKLGKRGILLRLEETGYCNGQLRVLKGEIIGSDGSRQGFETTALRQLSIQLEARTKALGIRAVKVKNRLKKCHPQAVDTEGRPDENMERDHRPMQQI